MDDELERAARRQRLKQREGAQRVQQRQREEAERKAELEGALPLSGSGSNDAASPSGASSSGAGKAATAPAAGLTAADPAFKEAVAAKFRELVATGAAPNEAAVQAIQLVREAAAAAAASALCPSPAPGAASAGSSGALKRQAPDAPIPESDVEEVVEVPCPGGPFTCFICIEEKAPHERFLPHRCSAMPSRMCCKDCYVAWVQSQIDAEAAAIKCCHCDLLLDARVLAWLVGASHWAKYCETAKQRLLRRDSTFIWCSKCPSGGWVDPRQPNSKCGWICPECSNCFVYCPFCRREHGSLSCKRFQQLRYEVLTGKRSVDQQSEGVVARNSKMCPSCKMPIQKEGGCNFMDCPNCRRHFCWSCGRILKGSHQAHQCDAGFEGSHVVHKTPNGQLCVELTRLFTNVLDIDQIELLNADEADLGDLKEMLVPGITQEARAPLFVGPSECDGEVLLRLPFNFRKSMSWELTHILLKATHPPAPHSYPPKSIALLPNVPSANFADFEDPTVITVQLQEVSPGVLLVPLEQFRSKGTFRRVTSLSLRLSVVGAPSDGALDAGPDPEAQVYFNDVALFGLPGECSAGASRHPMMDDRANLIVSPVLNRRRWGEEAEVEEALEEQVEEATNRQDALQLPQEDEEELAEAKRRSRTGP